MGGQAIRMAWIACGGIALAVGAAGVVLPLLPTTPFVLLAAFCFAKSSPRLHDWLTRHPIFGRLVTTWRRERAIPARAKRMAYASLATVFGISVVLGVTSTVLVVQALILAACALFIATRPTARGERP
jgi:hypothetical protein